MATGDYGKKGPQGQASSFYTRNISEREPYLQRARRLSLITVPSLFREVGAQGSTQEELPWNSVGAYLCSNLAASVVFAIFPPGQAPIKLQQDRKAAAAFQNDPNNSDEAKASVPAAIGLGLSGVEREFSDCMEEDGDRAPLTTCALRLIVGGQHGFQLYPDGTIRGITLEDHVTRRDKSGKLLAFGISDETPFEELTPEVQALCTEAGYMPDEHKTSSGEITITVYTYGWLRADGRWEVFEEVWGQEAPDTRRNYAKDDLPYFFPAWMILEKEHYGRSYVEWYEADLQTVEGLTQSITETASLIARFLMFVNPAGLTNRKAVAEAPNGAVLSGRGEDVTTPAWTAKAGDLRAPSEEKQDVMGRLAKAFLLATSIQRQGERVTAEEIRFVAQELEKAQAGMYALQVVNWQMPYAKLKLKALQRAGRVTKLPEGQVKMTILGGLAALGRTAEADALKQAVSDLAAIVGPTALPQVLGPSGMRTIASRLFAAYGVDPQGILPTPQQAQAMDQQAQTQALAANPAVQEGIKQAGQNLTSNQVADTNAQSKVQAAAASAQPSPPPDDTGAQ